MSDLQPTYLDCDTGIDDALALGYLATSPLIELVGVGTVSGNTDATTAARNTIDFLALLGNTTTPVAIGQRDFLRRPFHGGAPAVHGQNGIGEVALPKAGREPLSMRAAELLVELAHRYPGRLRVLAIGPLTNLALALDLDPSLPNLIRDVTIMGGAFNVPGNVTSSAEANIANDPEGADQVFSSSWTTTVIPLDVTTQHRFEPVHKARLLGSTSFAGNALGQMLDTYFEFYATVYGAPVALLHDPLAAAVFTGDAEVKEYVDGPVYVDTAGVQFDGRTRLEATSSHIELPARSDTRVILSLTKPFAPQLDRSLGTLN